MLLAEVYLVIFILSNKSIITWFSCQLVPNKLLMRANISFVILNIHQSKLIVAELQYTNFAKHIPILFSPPSWTIFLAKVIFLKESQLEVTKWKGRCLNHTFFMKLHKEMSFNNQKSKVLSKISFAIYHPFWDSLHQNNYILHCQTHWTFSSFIASPPSSSH